VLSVNSPFARQGSTPNPCSSAYHLSNPTRHHRYPHIHPQRPCWAPGSPARSSLEPEQFEQIVACRPQRDAGVHLFQPTQQEAPEPSRFFRLAKDGFDDRLAPGIGLLRWRPLKWCKSPQPPPRRSRGGPRTAVGCLTGCRCKGWAGPFPWFELYLNQTNHAQHPCCRIGASLAT